MLQDCCEQREADRVPLVAQLNTFFLSRHGKRRPINQINSNNASNLFPHIHATCEHTSQDLGDMTAASIINYKVPATQEDRRPVSHPKLTVQCNMDNNQQAMFKPMFERQKMQMFPMRTKSVSTSLNNFNQINSTAQTINHKRFSAIQQRRDSATDKGLPKSHILTAKTISRKYVEGEATSKQQRANVQMTNSDSNSSTRPVESPKRSRENTLLNYEIKSLHPYLNTYSPVDRNFGKAELVDYSSIMTGDYRT